MVLRRLLDEKVDLVYASPLICGNIGVAFTGWVNGPTIGFKLGGSGNVTTSNRLWREKHPQRIGSGVVVYGRVYIVNAGPGTAQCIECSTGEILAEVPPLAAVPYNVLPDKTKPADGQTPSLLMLLG